MAVKERGQAVPAANRRRMGDRWPRGTQEKAPSGGRPDRQEDGLVWPEVEWLQDARQRGLRQAQRLWPLRHGRQRLAVDGGLVRPYLQRASGDGGAEILPRGARRLLGQRRRVPDGQLPRLSSPGFPRRVHRLPGGGDTNRSGLHYGAATVGSGPQPSTLLY